MKRNHHTVKPICKVIADYHFMKKQCPLRSQMQARWFIEREIKAFDAEQKKTYTIPELLKKIGV